MESTEQIKRKRDRCVSFGADEKVVIANICAKYKNILENKKTDSVSAKEKNEIWVKISDEINSASVHGIYRSPDVLKRFYENRKREVRKIAAEEKQQIFATGGGSEIKIKKDACHDIILSIMNSKSVYGLENNVDGDAPRNESTENKAAETVESDSASKAKLNDIEMVYESDSETQELYYDNQEICEPSWKNYKASDFNKPITSALKRRLKNTDNSTPRKLLASRRRPAATVKALTSSELGAKYNLLVNKRIEIADLQKEKLQKDMAQEDEEKKLKLELYQIKIEVERKKLDKLLYE